MHLPRPVSMHPSHHLVYYIYTRGNHHSTFRHYSFHRIHSQWIIIVPESACRELNIIHVPYHQCDKLLGLAKGLQIAWKTTSEIIKLKSSRENVHVNDVVTDWSYALAGFLVSMLFGVSPANPSKFSHCKCFSIRIYN